MKSGDTVVYLGKSQEKINDNSCSHLIVGREYIIEDIRVYHEHTKLKLRRKIGWFTSSCFKKVNTISFTVNTMNPDDIALDTTCRMFEYEKISREIEVCEDIYELKNMCRCFVKLHLKHQEVAAQMMISTTID